MKKWFLLAFLTYAIPVAVVIALALSGIVWEFHVYLVIAITHLFVVSGMLWCLYRDTERKLENPGKSGPGKGGA